MAILREQFKPVAQSYPVPDALCQLPGLDVVHFARLTVLKVDALAAQPQSTIIHGAFHLLIHVVELQGFCHADLALLVPPPKLLGGHADAGHAGDLLELEPRSSHQRPSIRSTGGGVHGRRAGAGPGHWAGSSPIRSPPSGHPFCKFQVTMCQFDTLTCCNMITTVALASASIMSHNYHFYLW